MWSGNLRGKRMKHFSSFSYTVQCPGHRALPGYLPHRPHHARHGGQRQAGCELLSSLSRGKLVTAPGDCSVFYNYPTWHNTHPVTPFAERLHQLWQKEKGECCNMDRAERLKRFKFEYVICFSTSNKRLSWCPDAGAVWTSSSCGLFCFCSADITSEWSGVQL